MATPLSQETVREMAVRWYSGLDNHIPEVEMLKFLVTEDLEMQWPDYHVVDLASFEGWYQRALGIFFDEKHTLHEFTVTPRDDGNADVKVFVNWKARTWTPREAKSNFVDLEIHQTWIVAPSPDGTKPLIKFIRFDDGTPREGSSTL